MKKIILGATGSIGSSLAKKLIDAGDEVHLVGRDEGSVSSLAGDLGASNSPLITSNDAANQGKKGSKQPPKPFLRDTGEWNMFSQQKGD